MSRVRNTLSFDWAIKRQLRNKANYDIVSGFLSELFKRDFKITNILESGKNKKTEDGKENYVDVLAVEQDGSKVIIELQFNHEVDFFQRMIYESSSRVEESIGEGDSYEKISKVYSVNIMYFDLGMGKDYIYYGSTVFKGIHSKDILKLSKVRQERYIGKEFPADLFPEYYIINLNKFSGKIKDSLDEWVSYLKTDKIEANTKAKGLAKAKKLLDYDKLSPEDKLDYDHEVKRLRHLRSMFLTADLEGRSRGLKEGELIGEARGIEKGRVEGIANEKIETARRLKEMGLSIKQIAQGTGLSEKEIDSL